MTALLPHYGTSYTVTSEATADYVLSMHCYRMAPSGESVHLFYCPCHWRSTFDMGRGRLDHLKLRRR